MKYFAYGSNMDKTQMMKRCPSAEVFGIAMLPDHELYFPRKSKRWGCGVASIMQCKGKNVWGVIYDMQNPNDVSILDEKEGFYGKGNPLNCYEKDSCVIFLDGNKNNSIIADTYIAIPMSSGPFFTNSQYLNSLINGAKSHNLPDTYIKKLLQIETNEYKE